MLSLVLSSQASDTISRAPIVHTSSNQRLGTGMQDHGLNESVLLGSALFFAAATYAAVVRFAFVYDDLQLIVANRRLRSWRFVPDYFRGADWHVAAQSTANYYRPVYFLWLRADYAVNGGSPAGWHVASILLHLLAISLAYFVVRRLTGRPLVAGLTALFFGIHPMTHEVVACVSSNNESLWAVFAFGAFLCYFRFWEGRGNQWLVASCALYAASVLTKESAIVLPALIFAHALIYGRSSEERQDSSATARFWDASKVAICYVPIFVAYLVARIAVLHRFSNPQLHISAKAFLLTLPSVAFFYYKQWLLPLHVTEFYELPVSTHFNVAHVLLPICGLLSIAIVLWLFREKLGKREVAFAVVWMVLPLLPALDFVVFPDGDWVHDRYFYVPAFGASLLLALALEKLAKGPLAFGIPRRLLFPTLGLTLILCATTANAARYWRDNFVLFQHSYELAPHSLGPRVNYAIGLAGKGQYGDAIPMFQQILKEYPNNYLATYGLGESLYELGLLGPAEHFFQQTEQLNPQMAGVYLHLGLIEMKTGRQGDAVNSMRRALALRTPRARFPLRLGHGPATAGKLQGVARRIGSHSEAPGGLPAREGADREVCGSPNVSAQKN